MKIDNYKPPRSSFLSIEKDMKLIVDAILSNERLCKLLYYTTKDALVKPKLTQDQKLSLFGNQLKIVPKIEVDAPILNYLVVNFDNFVPSENPQFRNNRIEFDILCHYSQWELGDFALRPYKIAAEIDSMFKMSGLAVFKNNKLLGYLTEDESITYNIIKNNVENVIINYECNKNKYLSMEIVTSSSKITTKNEEINIDIKLDGNVKESSCDIELNTNKNIKTIEKQISKYLDNNIKKDIDNIRNTYNSDIFGFLDIIYRHDYNTYKLVKDTWYKESFKNINININTEINISSTGNIMEGNYD